MQIATEAKNSKFLKTDLDKAQTQLAYARIMHFLGFNRKAAEAAEAAHSGFTNKADQMDALDFAKLCRKLADYQEKRRP